MIKPCIKDKTLQKWQRWKPVFFKQPSGYKIRIQSMEDVTRFLYVETTLDKETLKAGVISN